MGRSNACELLGGDHDKLRDLLAHPEWDEREGLHVAEMLGMNEAQACSDDIQEFLGSLPPFVIPTCDSSLVDGFLPHEPGLRG